MTVVKGAPADGAGDATPSAATAGGGGATRAMWASPSQTVRRILHAASLEDLDNPTHTIRKPLAPEKDQIGVLLLCRCYFTRNTVSERSLTLALSRTVFFLPVV